MDASTIAPIAIAIPPNDIILAETSIKYMRIKLIITAEGRAMMGTIALGICNRNIRIINATTIICIVNSFVRVLIDRLIKSLLS